MGRDGDSQVVARSSSFTEIFEKACPYYMAFGMSYEQFWDGDVEMAKAYYKAYQLKQDHENEMAWLQGMYVYVAIGALAPSLKAFAKGRAQPYMKYPFGFEEKIKAQEEAAARRENETRKANAKTMMEVWAINFNEKWEKQQKEKAMNGGEDNGG